MSEIIHGLVPVFIKLMARNGGRAIVPDRTARKWQHIAENDKMRKVRRQIKRRRKSRPVRRKDWAPAVIDDPGVLDGLDVPQTERIMPRGERERRQDVVRSAMAALQEEADDAEESSPAAEMSERQGTVVEVSSSMCRVNLEGRILLCSVRGSLSARETGFTNVVAVGDHVIISEDGSGSGTVESVLTRRSMLARPDVFYGHLRQVIVANADQLLFVASWREPALWPELVDRCLIAAQRHNLLSVICVNKVDLAENMEVCYLALRPYLDLGYRVLFTSVLTGQGIDELGLTLRGQTTVLAGLSGVGKSSLLNAVQPGLQLRASEVSGRRHEGRHTTSQVNLLELEMGGYVVDTPGIREFGLTDLPRKDLVRFYPEIADAGRNCRFGNCSHLHEPNCAVTAAVRQGRVSETRYHNYRAIYGSLPA